MKRVATLAAALWQFQSYCRERAAVPARADEWSKTYQVSGRADLHVTTGDGDVTITGTDQKQIDARVTTEGWKVRSERRAGHRKPKRR